MSINSIVINFERNNNKYLYVFRLEECLCPSIYKYLNYRRYSNLHQKNNLKEQNINYYLYLVRIEEMFYARFLYHE